MIKKQALSSAFPIAMGFKPIAIFVFFAFAGVVTGKPGGAYTPYKLHVACW